MRYYADFIEEDRNGPRQPFADTDIYYVTDLDWLRECCESAAGEYPDMTFLILDRGLVVVEVYGWLRRQKENAVDHERAREQARKKKHSQPSRNLIEQVRERARDERYPLTPRGLLTPLADTIHLRWRGWIAVSELQADGGYYGHDYIGMPALRYRILLRVMEPALARLHRRLRRLAEVHGARPCREAFADPDVPF